MTYRYFLSGIILVLILFGCSKQAKTQDTPVINVYTGMRYLENERIKLGVNLSLGGAVTYLTDKENGGGNMINSSDWGRQIQLSYYSGPWPYIGPNGETPTASWANLGWNPIQSGDAGGNRSRVIAFESRGDDSFMLRSIPMQWPHTTGVPGECEFECVYTLNDNVITLDATIINHREDKTQYRACGQEMPAVYTNGPWYQLVTYLGDKPFSGEPVTTVVTKGDGKGWPWVHFYTPENWVALLDDNGVGIGVFQPEVMTFNGGFHPSDAYKGVGGEKDGQTGHIAPVGTQILDYNIQWTYHTSFVLGNINDIRNYAKQHSELTDNPAWVFDGSRKSWYYQGEAYDTGFPIEGMLNITFKKDAWLVGPVTFWQSAKAPVLNIEGAFTTDDGLIDLTVEIQPVGKSDFTDWLNWSEGAQSQEQENAQKASIYPATPSYTVTQQIQADGEFHNHKIILSNVPEYSGAMKNIKINMSKNGKARIKKISFSN